MNDDHCPCRATWVSRSLFFSSFLLFSFSSFLLFSFSSRFSSSRLPHYSSLQNRDSCCGAAAVTAKTCCCVHASHIFSSDGISLSLSLFLFLSPMLTSYHQTTNPPLMPGIRLMMTGHARTPLCPISIRSLRCTLHARWPSKSPLLFIHMPMLHHNLTRVEFSFLIMPTFARPLLLTRRLTRITPAKVIEMPECIRG